MAMTLGFGSCTLEAADPEALDAADTANAGPAVTGRAVLAITATTIMRNVARLPMVVSSYVEWPVTAPLK